jgi:response regulator RpfG family c-di-GMP phosphodiesterase
MKPPEGYITVRTSTLNARESLTLDVFVPVNGKILRYAAAGDPILSERYDRLKRFKLAKLLIRKQDEPLYRAFLDRVLAHASDAKRPLEERANAASASAEAAGQDVVEQVENAEIYARAKEQFETFARFLKGTPSALPLVLKSVREAPARDHVSHGTLVGTLALALAEKFNLVNTPGARAQLMAAAFLHDVSVERMGLPLRRAGLYTAEQETQWKTHTSKAAEHLGGLKHVDNMTMEIVSQHEEIPNGSGFPLGLHGKEMLPLAVIVSLVNRFDHALLDAEGKDLAETTRDFKVKTLGLYDLPLLEELERVVLSSL